MATLNEKTRAGRTVRQPEGYNAFTPASLPPDPPLRFDAQLATVLAGAGTALGRLDGVAATLPNPELFVAMYVRREAVLSSQMGVALLKGLLARSFAGWHRLGRREAGDGYA